MLSKLSRNDSSSIPLPVDMLGRSLDAVSIISVNLSKVAFYDNRTLGFPRMIVINFRACGLTIHSCSRNLCKSPRQARPESPLSSLSQTGLASLITTWPSSLSLTPTLAPVVGAQGGITLGSERGVSSGWISVTLASKTCLKDLYYHLWRMAREPLRSDKDGVRAGAGAIHLQDAGRGAADLA
jgi:hypothetical protein